MRKKILLLINAVALFACIFGWGACSGPDPVPNHVNINPHELKFSWQRGSSQTISVDASTNWVMDGPNNRISWLVASMLSGRDGVSTVTFTTISDNNEEVAKTEVVRITAEEASDAITVIQEGKPITYYLNVQPQVLGFGSQAAAELIIINSNDEWTATSSDGSWCTVEKEDNNSARVKVKENATPSGRETTVVITGIKSQKTAVVQVTQRGASKFDHDGFDEDIDLDTYNPYSFDISLTELAFDYEGSTKTIKVIGNDDWTASSSEPSWCKLSSQSGSSEATIDVTVDSFYSTDTRNAVITITGTRTGKAIAIQVTQKGNSELEREEYDAEKNLDNVIEFSVEPSALVFDKEESEQFINITGNDSWTAESDDVSWCTISDSKGTGSATIEVRVRQNETPTIRRTNIILKGTNTGKTIWVDVTQSGTGYTFSVSPASLSFEKAGSSMPINVTGNDDWTATSSATAWCTLSKNSGSGAATINVTTTKNTSNSQRTATITIKGKNTGKTITVNVIQKGDSGFDRDGYDQDKDLDKNYSLSVSPTSLSFEAKGSTQSISVTGNDEWTATSSATTWCTLSKNSGSGAATINVTATKNTSNSQRTATITVKGKNTGKTITVNVIQMANSGFDRDGYDQDKDLDKNYSLSASPTSLSFEAKGSTQSISVIGNDEWTATSSATTWCTLSKNSGSGAATINVTVTQNTSNGVRNTTISLKGKNTGKTITINVTQKGTSGFNRDGYDQDKNLDK